MKLINVNMKYFGILTLFLSGFLMIAIIPLQSEYKLIIAIIIFIIASGLSYSGLTQYSYYEFNLEIHEKESVNEIIRKIKTLLTDYDYIQSINEVDRIVFSTQKEMSPWFKIYKDVIIYFTPKMHIVGHGFLRSTFSDYPYSSKLLL